MLTVKQQKPSTSISIPLYTKKYKLHFYLYYFIDAYINYMYTYELFYLYINVVFFKVLMLFI